MREEGGEREKGGEGKSNQRECYRREKREGEREKRGVGGERSKQRRCEKSKYHLKIS